MKRTVLSRAFKVALAVALVGATFSITARPASAGAYCMVTEGPGGVMSFLIDDADGSVMDWSLSVSYETGICGGGG